MLDFFFFFTRSQIREEPDLLTVPSPIFLNAKFGSCARTPVTPECWCPAFCERATIVAATRLWWVLVHSGLVATPSSTCFYQYKYSTIFFFPHK